MPPDVVYTILIHHNFRVTAFRGHHQIAIKDLIPTSSHVLNRYSQLNNILQRVKETLKSEIKSYSSFIKDLSKEEEFTEGKQQRSIAFLCNQLNSFDSKIKEYNVEKSRMLYLFKKS